jgi:hypothetical protein
MAKRVILLLLAVISSMSLALTASAQAAPATATDRVSFAVPLTATGDSGQVHAQENCGTIWLDLADRGNGVTEFYYGYNVTLGTVYFHTIKVVWANLTVGRIDHFDDDKLWIRTYYANTKNVATGAGHVKSRMGVVVRLTNGITCFGATGDAEVTIT